MDHIELMTAGVNMPSTLHEDLQSIFCETYLHMHVYAQLYTHTHIIRIKADKK